MTVYNGARHLREAVDSILTQTFPNLELIIVDDFSTDETPVILAEYAERDARVRLLRNDRNQGPYPSANRALEVARAPLIARMDADDISAPDRLARQVAFLDAHPDCMLVGGGYQSIDEEGRLRYVKRNPMDSRVAGWTARFRMPMVHPSFCFRSRFPDGTSVRYGEDFPIAQDYALASRLARRGEIAVLDGILVHYRMHALNISTKRIADQKSAARGIAANNLRHYYPREISEELLDFLDALYKLRDPELYTLRRSIAAMRAAIDIDADIIKGDRRWLNRRCSGMLAEAFLSGPGNFKKGMMAIYFSLYANSFLLPLIARVMEVRGWIEQRPGPPEIKNLSDSRSTGELTPEPSQCIRR